MSEWAAEKFLHAIEDYPNEPSRVPHPDPEKEELLLLRRIARTAQALLNAPYLPEHTAELRREVAAWREHRRRSYS